MLQPHAACFCSEIRTARNATQREFNNCSLIYDRGMETTSKHGTGRLSVPMPMALGILLTTNRPTNTNEQVRLVDGNWWHFLCFRIRCARQACASGLAHCTASYRTSNLPTIASYRIRRLGSIVFKRSSMLLHSPTSPSLHSGRWRRSSRL